MTDRELIVSTAGNRNSKNWTPRKITWSRLAEKLGDFRVGDETHDEYMRSDKARQDELKDIGGFVGGKIVGGRRQLNNVESRDVVSLDLDNIPKGKGDTVLQKVAELHCAAVVYSTRKHTDTAPRLRVIIPLSSTVTPEQYQPIARKIADSIGIEMCDPTTFEINRLMYWPSCSIDSEPVYSVYEGDLLDPERILSSYGPSEEWKDVVRWPTVPGTEAKIQSLGRKKGDPEEKRGYVGAWNRNHDIYDALENILIGVYLPTEDKDRWSFSEGSTTGGAIVFDEGKFLFSYHSTDPACGQLLNSWDLCRLHLFGHLDADAKDEDKKHPDRLPSWKAMKEHAKGDTAVLDDVIRQNTSSIEEDFGAPTEASEGLSDDDVTWQRELIRDENGKVKPLQENFIAILRHDPRLQGIRYNRLNYGIQVTDDSRIPWTRAPGKSWSASDDAGARNYIALTYHISGKDKFGDAVLGVSCERGFDPIIEYLESIEPWDGQNRIDTLLVDYLGAEDTAYTRIATRKTLIAAIARQYEPGRKFDTVLTLVGPQGVGKSTFFAKLAGDWFADGLVLTDMRDKTGAEKLQGRWIVEMGELVGMKRAEEEAVKSFLSCRDDVYRGAYTANAVSHPRRCVIVGTTNAEQGFLRDATGNRRFWPVPITGEGLLGSVDDMDDHLIKMIWAEALAAYRAGEALYIQDDLVAQQAREAQRQALEQDTRSGIIRDYLDRLLPDGWEDMDIGERRIWLSNDFGANKGTNIRETVCAMEIWCECYGNDKARMTRTDANDIRRILSEFPEWSHGGRNTRRCGPYGPQRYFERLNISVLRAEYDRNVTEKNKAKSYGK